MRCVSEKLQMVLRWAVALGTGAVFAEGNATWSTSVAEGYYTNKANWAEGALPTAGATASFTAAGGDQRVIFGRDGAAENAVTFVQGGSRTLAFDASDGGWWLKTHGAYPQAWQAFNVVAADDVINNHLFALESVPTADGADDLFLLTNGVIRVKGLGATGVEMTVDGGELDFLHPRGQASYAGYPHTGGFDSRSMVFVVTNGAHVSAAKWLHRGRGNGSAFRVVAGSRVDVANEFTLKDLDSNGELDAGRVELDGGTLNVGKYYGGKFAANLSGGRAYTTLTNGSSFATTGEMDFLYAGGTHHRAELRLSDTSEAYAGTILAAVAQGTNNVFLATLANTSRLTAGERILLAYGGSSNEAAIALTNRAVVAAPNIRLAQGGTSVTGRLDLAGSAQALVGCLDAAGSGLGNVAEVTVRNQAALWVTNGFSMNKSAGSGAAAGSRATIRLRDEASFVWGGSGQADKAYALWGAVPGSVFEIDAADRATIANRGLYASQVAYIGYNVDAGSQCATGIVRLAGQSVATFSGDVYLGYANNASRAAYGRLEVGGNATCTLPSGYCLLVGASKLGRGEVLVKDSATCEFSQLTLGTRVAAPIGSVYRQTGGAVTCEWGMKVTGQDVLFELSGGTFTIGTRSDASCRLGGVEKSSNAVLRVTGGRYVTQTVPLTVAECADTTAAVELNGGVMEAIALRAGAGVATLRANGGTLAARAATAAYPAAITGFATAELGAAGLTLDDQGNAVTNNQSFTDADGAEGLFVKTGVGSLAVRTASSHARTRVTSGTFVFAAGVTRFGRTLEIAGGAADARAADLALDGLTLGNATRVGRLVLDPAHPVTLASATALSIPNGMVELTDSATTGTITLFTTADGAFTADQFANLRIYNRTSGRRYAFSAEGGILRVTITEHAAVTTSWTGAQSSDWNVSGNWSGGVPTDTDTAVFPETASTRAVTLSGAAALLALQFASSQPYAIGGDGYFSGINAISVTAGSHEIGADLKDTPTLDVDVANAATVRVSRAVGVASDLEKTGSGTLALAGDNTDSAGSFASAGGTLAAESATAFGATDFAQNTLNLTGGTLSWRVPGVTTLNKPLTLNGANPMVVDVATGTLALAQPLAITQGALVKTGAGDLSVTLPAGQHDWDATSGKKCTASSEAVVLPANGDSPSWNGLSVFNVLEGGVTLAGAGADVTTVDLSLANVMLGGYAAARCAARLDVRNLRANFGSTGYYTFVGFRPTAAQADLPAALCVDGAKIYANGFCVNCKGDAATRTYVFVTNGLVSASFCVNLPHDDSSGCAVVRVGAGGVLASSYDRAYGRSDANAGGGVHLGRCDVRVEDGGEINGGTGMPFFYNNVDPKGATCVFARGGRLTCRAILGMTPGAYYTPARTTFDAAVLTLTTSDTSLVASPDRQVFDVAEGGLEVAVATGLSPTLALPLSGVGTVTKTGTGTLVLSPCLQWRGWTAVTNVTSLASLATTGGVAVASGTVTVLPGAAPTVPFRVGEEGTLAAGGTGTVRVGTVTGSGVVTGGTLSPLFGTGASAAETPLYENIALEDVRVDFGCTEASPAPLRAARPVARLGTGVTGLERGVSYTVKAVNTGRACFTRAKVTVANDGTVTAMPVSAGFGLIFR